MKTILAAFTIAASLALQAQDVISFSIASPKNANQNYMYSDDYAGAPGARTNNWNNLLATADGSAADITLYDGSVIDAGGNLVSGMSVMLHPSSTGGGIYNRTSGGANDGKMYADVEDAWNCNGFGQYGYIDITNIPYANYNIYCYFRPDNGSGPANTRGGFWLITNAPSGSLRYYVQNQSNDVAQTQLPVPSSSGANYIQSTTTSIPSGGAAWSDIQGGNYAVFSNLTNTWTRVWFAGLGNGGGAVDDLGNSVNGGSPAVRFKVSGFQIVQVPTGLATSLYLQSTNLTMHAGNPAGTQLAVLADLDTGATGVDVTTASGIAYSVTDTNVATVSATGLLKPGTNGTANLIVSYQSLSLTNPITVIGPTSLSLNVANPNLLYGNGQGDATTATLYANFSDASNVVVNAYAYVSFSGTGGIISVSSNGAVAATGVGSFSITGMYDGVSVTSNNVGVVSAFTAPVGVSALSVNLANAANTMKFHDLSGAPGARSAYWNNMIMSFGNVTNEIASPVDHQGNVMSGTVVQVLPNNPPNQSLAALGTRTTDESVMFNTVFDQGANNGTSPDSYIVVSNVPYATYDAYFYFWNDAGQTNRPGRVTINGVTQYRINGQSHPNTPSNDGSGYVQALPQTAGLPASITEVPFGNYIKFSGLTDADLNVTWGAVGQDYIGDANAVTRLRLAGFQIVKSLAGLTATNIYLQSAVPAQLPGNPATCALTVLADFSDGTMGGNITALDGITFGSSNPNVFQVDTNGIITPGLTPGTATLTVNYQSATLNQTVTNLAPLAVTVSARPDTLYLDSYNGVGTAQASASATFAGYGSVDISGFNSVSFSDLSPSVAYVGPDGSVSPANYGIADLGVMYLGTAHTNAGALAVISISSAPTLKHRYSFRDSGSTIVDSVGGANGTVIAPLSGGSPVVMDGDRANFPANTDYSVAPYIALPAGIISARGDVTIDMWAGANELKTWERFFDIGSSGKGTDAHNSGSGITSLFCTPYPGGSAYPRFSLTSAPGTTEVAGTAPMPLATETHLTLVYSYNQNIVKMYVNGALANSTTPLYGASLQSLNDQNVWLGASLWNDPPLNGWINELRIYEGAFSDNDAANSEAAGPSVGLVSATPTNIVSSVSGGTLSLSWPADHLGWKLQVQTNDLSTGLGTNWVTVPGSDSMTSTNITINPANGSAFYRLMYQP